MYRDVSVPSMEGNELWYVSACQSPVTCDRTLFLGQKNIQQKFGKVLLRSF